jgi:leucyl-tRNA synthetase
MVGRDLTLTVFTKSPQTIYGVSALALAINHPLLPEIISVDRQKAVEKFCATWKDRESQEIAAEFTGSYGYHPLTNEKLPL